MRYIKKDGVEAISYTPEERKKALDISLTAIASALGYTPVRAGSHYHLKEMDSLIIYNDRSWNRWSGKGNKTGGTQIDFMMEYGGAASVPEAIKRLLDFSGEGMAVAAAPAANNSSSRNDGFSMELPPKNNNFRRMYAYLIQTRGVSQEVVSDFVHRRLIYEDSVHHNIVYCGMDPEGNIRYAGLRGTGDIYGKSFKMDVPGNNKNYGVNIVNKESDELKVFESVIDCMSYIDMYKDNVSNKLILGMVEDNPLVQFLKDYSHIKSISFCLDNDEAAHIALYGRHDTEGNITKQGLVEKYKEQGYSVRVEVPERGKDFNEMLKSKLTDQQIEELAYRIYAYAALNTSSGQYYVYPSELEKITGISQKIIMMNANQILEVLNTYDELLEPAVWDGESFDVLLGLNYCRYIDYEDQINIEFSPGEAALAEAEMIQTNMGFSDEQMLQIQPLIFEGINYGDMLGRFNSPMDMYDARKQIENEHHALSEKGNSLKASIPEENDERAEPAAAALMQQKRRHGR